MAARPSSVDLFCRVVDNFGDIGVSWRLARQLVVEEGIAVRLIVDRLDVAHALVPQVAPDSELQNVEGVRVQHWRETGLHCDADMVIEAFACELPADYLASMAARAAPPVWINLEYLSAEAWVGSHHGLPSPHPHLPLTKHFFFPGFGESTGGLIRERSVRAPENATQKRGPLRIFAFAYEPEQVAELCDAIMADGRPALVRAAGMKVENWRAITANCGLNAAPALEFAEFVPQIRFDMELASHDLLLVRGEDSLVRALWLGRPFVWQLYRQQDEAHHPKLTAFLDEYSRKMPGGLCVAWRDFSFAWNGVPGYSIGTAWPALRDQWPAWTAFAHARALEQLRQPDLVSNLLSFFGKLARI